MSGLRGFLFSWFLPKPASFFCGLELRRCQTDGQIVTMNNLQFHAGHFVKSPVVLTLREKVLIWLKIIR